MRYWSWIVLGLFGCQKESQFLTSLYQRVKGAESQLGDYQATPGSSATAYLQKTFRDQKLEVTGLLGALRVGQDRQAALIGVGLTVVPTPGLDLDVVPTTGPNTDTNSVTEVDTPTEDTLVGGQNAKINHKRSDYGPIDPEFFTVSLGTSLLEEDHSKDMVTWSKAESEFTVSVMERMPVRDQGQRGTCASFAGIGHLEGFLIKKYALTGIDLSEQRFYFMSKPDSWSTGGDKNRQGSDSGTGFAKSAGIDYKGASYPPGSPADYNIPLETDCAYNSKLGNNDLQTPQAAGCQTGVVKVTNAASWLYNYDQRLSTAQQIYDSLVKNDLPVVVGTRLSANWEVNDGLITLKGASGTPGDTSHAAGHAYMIVGARRLDEAKHPGEGGMCFIIRNSWGRGWGVGGYSCMTLAWFNVWRFQSPFPVIYDADLDPKKFQEAKAYLDNKPKNVVDPVIQKPTTAGARRGTVSFLTEESGKTVTASDFVVGALRSDKDELSKILYIKGDGFLVLRGVLEDGESTTSDLTLQLNDSKALILNHAAKGDVEVGSLDHDAKIITLCAQKYGRVCEINYVETDRSLVIGLTKDEYEREESSGPYEWKTVGVGSYAVEFSKPSGLNARLDIRFVNAGNATNPLRFNLDPLTGKIQFANKAIGSLSDGKFCTGSFASICRVVLNKDRFRVLFNGSDQ